MVSTMNANELANLLEVDSWYKLVTKEEIATMLRQQQAEIDKFKNLLLDNQILLDKTLNAWAKEMERKK